MWTLTAMSTMLAGVLLATDAAGEPPTTPEEEAAKYAACAAAGDWTPCDESDSPYVIPATGEPDLTSYPESIITSVDNPITFGQVTYESPYLPGLMITDTLE